MIIYILYMKCTIYFKKSVKRGRIRMQNSKKVSHHQVMIRFSMSSFSAVLTNERRLSE